MLAQSLIIDFVYRTSTNPAKITDANYSGVPVADVQVYLQFTAGAHPKVTLQAEPHGDVVGLKINPATAPIKAGPVKNC